MNHTLELQLNNSPEVLERILRVARHRGFTVQLLNWLADTSSYSQLQMTVNSERPIHLLNNQLQKLYDVIHVKILDSQAPQTNWHKIQAG